MKVLATTQSSINNIITNHRSVTKIESHSIRGGPLISFLNQRSQAVCISSKSSKSIDLSYGVPQGSIPSSVHFLLYVSDVNKSSLLRGQMGLNLVLIDKFSFQIVQNNLRSGKYRQFPTYGLWYQPKMSLDINAVFSVLITSY
ncbi:hypothetical protein J6590_065120 [Homalodisca vitripennis]|nr:hypothetical protein J6590_065120 [Homalodisca vitripennis]